MYGFKILSEISKGTFEISHKFWTHTPQNMYFTIFNFCVWVTISLNCDVISLSETGPWCVVAMPPGYEALLICYDYIVSFCGFIWYIYPYSSGLLHWYWDIISPVPVKWSQRLWVKLAKAKSQQTITNCELCPYLHGCSSASEVTQKSKSKIDQYRTTIKCEP